MTGREPHPTTAAPGAEAPGAAAPFVHLLGFGELALAELGVFLDVVPGGAVVVDRCGEIVLVNEEALALFGHDHGELVGRPVEQLLPEYLREAHADQRASYLEAPARRSMGLGRELTARRRDGGELHVAARLVPLETTDGPYVMAALDDLTERKLVESELRLSEERYRGLFENAADIMLAVDLEGNVTEMNRAGHACTGYDPNEAAGLNIVALIASERLDDLWADLARQLTGATDAAAHELELACKGGRRLPVELVAKIIRPDGEPIGFHISCRDLTSRKQLEEQLIQAQKLEAVGRLAGGVAHDFNNVLTVIRGYTGVLLAELAEGDPRRGDAERILAAAVEASGFVKQLLVFSRRDVPEPRVLDLNALASEMTAMLGHLIDEDVELMTLLDPEPRWVKVDRFQLEQVIANLAVNARDAMPEGGTLTVRTASAELQRESLCARLALEPGTYAVLEVTDTGTGIDEATRSRLFEPFFTTKEPGKGTGLGLATVYAIVTQSGGAIVVRSEPLRGATFTVYLPQVDEPAEQAEEPDRPAASTGSETVLLVEDNEGVRELVRAALVSSGYTVFDVPRPSEALVFCREHDEPIDLLVTDVVLPEMSGPALAERLLAERPGTRVLYVSGYSDGELSPRGALEEGVALLRKPFDRVELSRKVREVLDERRAVTQNGGRAQE